MSIKKVGNKSRHGGRRKRAGRKPTGITKKKLSVSVDRKVLKTSLEKWQDRDSTSSLVELLLRGYADGLIRVRPQTENGLNAQN